MNTPDIYTVKTTTTAVRQAPGEASVLETELLRGEGFVVEEIENGWAHGVSEIDNYPGFVEADHIEKQQTPPTHRVTALATRLYEAPDAKAQAGQIAWFGSLVTLTDGGEVEFLECGSCWLPKNHVNPLSYFCEDWAGVAELFVGTPYLYGGRTPAGLDCSALLQLALQASGRYCPRDSGPQLQTLGKPIAEGDALQRGDLAFWEGHVGIFLDAKRFLHANAYHMAVAIEPFVSAMRRIDTKGVCFLGIRRLPAGRIKQADMR